MLLDVVGCRWMPLDVVGCRWMPLDAVGCLGCRWTPLDAVGRRWTSLDVVGCRWMSLDVVGCRWMPLDVNPTNWDWSRCILGPGSKTLIIVQRIQNANKKMGCHVKKFQLVMTPFFFLLCGLVKPEL